MSGRAPKRPAVPDGAEALRARIAQLEAEKADLEAHVYVLKLDVKLVPSLTRENRNLQNLLNAMRAEIARLTAPKPAHRPRKDQTGTYELYLYRHGSQLITEALSRGEKLTEQAAAILADKQIRADAAVLQRLKIPGAFAGLAAKHKPEAESIAKAWRRGKRAAGFSRAPKATK